MADRAPQEQVDVRAGSCEVDANIEQGCAEIKAYVDKQPKELQKLAGDTAKDVAERFSELESAVTERAMPWVDDVAQRYVAAPIPIRNTVSVPITEEEGVDGSWREVEARARSSGTHPRRRAHVV